MEPEKQPYRTVSDDGDSEQPDTRTVSIRPSTRIAVRRQKRWRYFELGFVVVWIVGNLLRPGSIGSHLSSPTWLIGTFLGGVVLGILFGYVVKTLYAMQRKVRHKRLRNERSKR